MRFFIKILNILFKKQKILEFCVIFLISLSIGFSFGDKSVKWFWNDYPFIPMILVITGLLLSLLWIRIEKHKTQIIINEIKNSSKDDSSEISKKIDLLTNRQREVFELILKGKSNKEIMSELYIELSTLKTHINHIYKTLEIINRKEARAIGKLYSRDQT